ncbi:hypothetical protein [Sphingobacterium tabacisoli]|uniref:Lipoprotein n=1 Tax=Sphingobacterium tabacisoli TaxID=2044855 RepID=A0ABW5KYY7_9SPHI|nr:hypothetical protein [Sphingobacterium tabacisoli]
MKTTILAALAGVFLMTSCGDGGVYPQNEGGGKAVKQLIDKHFDADKQVQELVIKAKDELYGELGTITAVYWDGDKQMEDVFSATDGMKEPAETFGSKQKMKHLAKTKTVAVKEFDVDPIPYKIGEAVELIPEEYENYALAEYGFTVEDNGKIKQRFTINTTKKGEGKTQTGRMVSQNYYPFSFKIDESGKVVAID